MKIYKKYAKFDKKYKEIYTLTEDHQVKVTYAFTYSEDEEAPEGYLEVIKKNSKPLLTEDEELMWHMTRFPTYIEKEFLAHKKGAIIPPDVEVERNIKISKKKLRDILKAKGIWQDFKDLIYSNEELQELWEISLTLEERDPYVQGAIQMIKDRFSLTDEDIEELLIASKSDLK